MYMPICLLLATSALVFDKDVSGKKTEISWQVATKDKLIEIMGKAEGKITEITADLSYKIEKYLSQQPDNQSTFTVTRDHDTLNVEMNSTSENKQKQYNIGGKNWVQDFSFGLRPFFISDADEYKFEIVNPKDLVMRTMVAYKDEIDYKMFNNVQYRARKVKITLDGFYKKFWKAELWYDTETLNLLYYKANEGPSTPYTILTIKELKK